MKRHWFAMMVGALMVLAGLLRMQSAKGFDAYEPVMRLQQWTLVIGGLAALLLGRLAATKPRNAGFGVILASVVVLISSAASVPFQAATVAVPGIVLGLLGVAAGFHCMFRTRIGDA